VIVSRAMNQDLFRHNLRDVMARRMLAAVGIATFMVQVLALAHAVEHGDHVHEHDGHVCALSMALTAAGDDDVLLASSITLAIIAITLPFVQKRGSAQLMGHMPFARSPRGPPQS